MRSLIVLLTAVILTLPCTVFCDDFPGFRGADRSGFVNETGLLDSWPEKGPELLWSVEGKLGVGWSSACVVNDIVYIAGMNGESKIGSVWAIAQGGNILWETQYGDEWAKSFPGARNTPTYSDGKIYMNSGLSQITCLNASDGKIIWEVDSAAKYKVKHGRWGESDSVLPYKNMVIVAPGGEEAGVVALDKETGQELWATKDFTESAVYCSPVLAHHNGLDIVLAVMADSFAGIEAKTGKVLWKVAYSDYEKAGGRRSGARANCPLYSDGKVFLSCGYDKGSGMFEIAPDGNSVKVLGAVEEFDTHMGGVVRIGDYIYGTNSDRAGNKWLSLNWQTGKYGYQHNWEKSKGSLIAADGKLYCYNEQLGIVALVKANPEKFEIISQFKVEKGSGEHWAHPSISNGKLYIHRGDSLFVYKIK